MFRSTRALPPVLFSGVALVALVLLAYWPGLDGGWLFDDYSNIVRRTGVHLDSVSPAALYDVMREGFGHAVGRPLAMVTFAIDHVVWGKDTWGYKLTSVVVHVVNALLVFVLVRRLLRIAWPARAEGPAAAACIAAIWAIHPLQVSTVLYVVQRMETLSLMFVLLALLAWLAGRARQLDGRRGWPWLLAAAGLVGLGLLCKETAALFPAYTLALELTLLGFGAADPAAARRWRIGYAIACVAAIAILVFVALPVYGTPERFAIRDFDLGDRLLTQLRVLPMYLGWIVLPQPGHYVFYYDDFVPSRGLVEPWTTLAGGVFLVGLLAAAVALRRRMPLAALGMLWFFAAHALTSSVLPLELVFEHRNYFALLGVVLVGADLLFRMPASEVPRVRTFAVGVVIAGLLVLTLIRSATWGQPLNLALALVDKNPTSSRASMDLGEQYMLRARRDPASRWYAMAVEEFERGSRIPNSSPMPEQGLIVLAAQAGQPADPAWWDRIVDKLTRRAIGPQEMSMITGLLRMRQDGLVFDDERFAEAYLVFDRKLQMPPSQYFVFGEHALEHVSDRRVARHLFARAVERAEGDAELISVMAQRLLDSGHPEEADVIIRAATAHGVDIRIRPSESTDE